MGIIYEGSGSECGKMQGMSTPRTEPAYTYPEYSRAIHDLLNKLEDKVQPIRLDTAGMLKEVLPPSLPIAQTQMDNILSEIYWRLEKVVSDIRL